MHTPPLTVEEHPSAQDLEFLETQINEYNMAQVNAYDGRLLAIFARDPAGTIVAGVSGYTWAGFCELQFLWVHETMRKMGIGSRLLAAAETEARARGCGLVVLSSYSFQAPAFYKRHGYQIVGYVDQCPPNHRHYFFRKAL